MPWGPQAPAKGQIYGADSWYKVRFVCDACWGPACGIEFLFLLLLFCRRPPALHRRTARFHLAMLELARPSYAKDVAAWRTLSFEQLLPPNLRALPLALEKLLWLSCWLCLLLVHDVFFISSASSSPPPLTLIAKWRVLGKSIHFRYSV